MEIEIFEKKENVLFDRTEVKFYVSYVGEPTPKLLDVKSKLVAMLDTKKELIVVDNIQPDTVNLKQLVTLKCMVENHL